MTELNTSSLRARKARMAQKASKSMVSGLLYFAILAIVFSIVAIVIGLNPHATYAGLSLGLFSLMLGCWYRYDLTRLPAKSPAKTLDDILEPNLLAEFGKTKEVSPKTAWQVVNKVWQGRYFTNRLLLHEELIAQGLSEEISAMKEVWDMAVQLMADSKLLTGGEIAAALLITSANADDYLKSINLGDEDVKEVLRWQQRLERYILQPKGYFGGIGRDWATGYTPTLERFGHNVSLEIEAGGGNYHTLSHTEILDSIVHNLGRGSGGVAIVGESGVGKTALAYALGERLLSGTEPQLRYYQIISLNASQILSASGNQLERIMLTLFAEAVHARNIIIFLDDARLFFGSGPGAFDLGQILMPILKNRSVKLVAAFTPTDFQHLKASNEALVGSMSVVNVTEPPQDVVMNILEDTALTLGHRDDVMITYEAVREAYRLSGQYMQEQAYPGKAISLMDQAIPFSNGKVMTAASVQTAIEKTRGLKVAKAEGPEADVLLHLEDMIHTRMINQTKAVKAVAAALRRGRAGVANPNRPVGSFLFLGPTGVGKTELARSLAATYFGDEHNMIRLDMSEYQQPSDVDRLLSSGKNDGKSLIMAMREQPFSVVLFDEIEKAHPNILNLLLQILDEGKLTDQNDKSVSFKNAIIINTSNAGSAEITKHVAAGEELEDFERPLIDQLISQGIFRPELINRFDEVVLFRPLNQQEMGQVALLMIGEVNQTLAKQNVSVELTDAAIAKIVATGYDPVFGARPMRRVIQKMVEDAVASRILSGQTHPGDVVKLDVNDLSGDK